MSEEKVVVIPEEPVKEEPIQLDIEELSEEEKEMAKKHGLDGKKPDEELPGKKVKKAEPKKEEISNELKEEDYDTFDKVHDLYEHDKDKFYSLPRSVKNQYHNSKGLYKKLKDEEEKRKKLEDDNGYAKLHDSIAKGRIERLSKRILEAKQDPENKALTIEEVEEIINLQKKEEDKDRPMTVKDFEAMKEKDKAVYEDNEKKQREHQQFVADKIKETEIYAKKNISDLTDGKYTDFNAVVTLADEISKSKPRFARQIAEVLNGDDSIEDVVDTIISIAKIHPKWGEPNKDGKKIDIERIEKNAQRTKTSANITSGNGGKIVSFEDLTPEDAVKLTKEQWDKVPRKIRQKLLMEVS